VTSALDLYCAVDILGGGAVRLTKGDFGTRTEHGDPVALALQYVRSGARLLHVVDLDAARGGEPVNRDLVLRIVHESGVPVQVGGGARTSADVTGLLDAGVARIVLSTLAVEDPELVKELANRYPGRVAIGIDHHPQPDEPGVEMVAVRGWEHSGGVSVDAVLARFADVPLGAVVVTSIERDGMLSGPDTTGVAGVLAVSPHPVIASGGVRSAVDLAVLGAVSVEQPGREPKRLAGAVVGRALANGSLQIGEAIAACER
jgi:phosphoribosylformimino-5-aminoimidazole carboxamide ribotide isomerase